MIRRTAVDAVAAADAGRRYCECAWGVGHGQATKGVAGCGGIDPLQRARQGRAVLTRGRGVRNDRRDAVHNCCCQGQEHSAATPSDAEDGGHLPSIACMQAQSRLRNTQCRQASRTKVHRVSLWAGADLEDCAVTGHGCQRPQAVHARAADVEHLVGGCG